MKDLLERWLEPDGIVSGSIVRLFKICGRELPQRELPAVVEVTQEWLKELRPEGSWRWEMDQIPVGRKDELLRICQHLLLTDPSPKINAEGKTLVVLGATLRSMRHRLGHGLQLAEGVDQVIMLTSLRLCNKQEQQDLCGALGVLPIAATERDAAHASLMLNILPEEVKHSGVFSTPNNDDGRPARTDETIEMLVSAMGHEDLIFVTHQPFLRQGLTILRMYQKMGIDEEPLVLLAPPLSPLEDKPEVLLDEAIRFLYELGKVPETIRS